MIGMASASEPAPVPYLPCVSLGVIRDAGFTEEELTQVLSGNAERLFKGLADNG